MPKTMFQKIWDRHVIVEEPGRPALLYIDLHLLHEVTSPQAFEGLRLAGRKVRRPDLTFATMDHNVPTTDRSLPIADEISAKQIATLERNCKEFGITLLTSAAPIKASSTSSGRSRGLRNRARPSSAATATPPPTAPLARWPLASAPARWSTSSPPSACGKTSPRPLKFTSRASWDRALRRKTSSSGSSARSAPVARRAPWSSTRAPSSARSPWSSG